MGDPRDWLERYGDAWKRADGAAAAELFTEDAEYLWGPFEAPLRGREAIRRRWDEATAGGGAVAFDADVLGRDGDRVFVRWVVEQPAGDGAVVGLDGVFVLDFAPDGRCARLQEWWMTRP